MNNIQLIKGDCIDKLKELDDNSVDSVVTDPPYGLAFMGKAWDKTVPSVEVWQECLRVLKPGGHLLAFAGTRTQHRMAVNIEDAGFEIRDMIAWVYGSGFPKSHNISKAIDKIFGAEREVIGTVKAGSGFNKIKGFGSGATTKGGVATTEWEVTSSASDEAKQWSGWGTGLKPAMEPITVARKPFKGSVANNVLEHGTGGLNIDESRIPINPNIDDSMLGGRGKWKTENAGWVISKNSERGYVSSSEKGRWPANFIHDGSEEVVNLFPDTKSGFMKAGTSRKMSDNPNKNTYGHWNPDTVANDTYGDSGNASRFFYCAKASKVDRDAGLDGFDDEYYELIDGVSEDVVNDIKNILKL